MDCRHWGVTSPSITTTYSEWEPQEEYHCWAEVEADSPRDAIIAAIKHKDMADWVNHQRRDGCNPFTGLVAERMLCDHGTCFGCTEDCWQCNKEFENDSVPN